MQASRAALALVVSLASGCALDQAVRIEDPPCCDETALAPDPPLPPDAPGRDFAARVEGAARCEQAARTLLPDAPDEAWRRLRACVDEGHFTALRSLLEGAWDRELATRADAPLLVARVIAQRGGDVDDDLRLVHERRVPLFALSQALARPELYRGALVILRARISAHGVLDETRLVSQLHEVPLGPTDRIVTHAPPPWSSDSRRLVSVRRAYNVDVTTGRRVLGALDDPFVDDGDSLVVLGRFDGLRDDDGWPAVSVLAHWLPSPTLSY
jgi:hypothetical protein